MAAAAATITTRTGVLGVIGHPIAHSLSPRIHNAAFHAQGLDLAYLAFDVLPESLSPAIQGVRALGMRGVNLTVPHKEMVLELLDEVDPLAARVGAANTVVHAEGRLKGYNTDVSGFRDALRSLLPQGARGLHCLVVGAGGAARAVVAALIEDGAATVHIHNRTLERARVLCAAAAAWGKTTCEAVSAERLHEIARSADLLVNATSLGLSTSVKELPLPVDILHSGHVVVDLAYRIGPTPLVEAARALGVPAVDGKEMLVRQAAGSYSLWTGLEAPVNVMYESVRGGER